MPFVYLDSLCQLRLPATAGRRGEKQHPMKTRVFFTGFFLTFFTISTFIVNSNSQEAFAKVDTTWNWVDASGLRQGNWIITAQMCKRDDYGYAQAVVKTGTYLNSNREGEWVEYNPGGIKKAWMNFKSDLLHGGAKYYYNDGLLYMEMNYSRGIPDGIAKKYYRDGTLWTEFTWKNGRIDGPAKTYYPSGKLCEEGMWQFNGWGGEYKIYREDGSLKRTEHKPYILVLSDAVF